MTGLTIFTPTYNRAHLLGRVFASLQKQKSKNFEWLIVDDGSIDNTKDVVEQLTSQADFQIKYFFQVNAGKQSAQNRAVDIAEGLLFLCLDSDDVLASEDTVQSILDDWDACKDAENCVGLISRKATTEQKMLGDPFPTDVSLCTPVALRSKYHSGGERNYIVLTSAMRENKYPYFEGERFCPDSYVYDRLSCHYVMALRNQVDEVCEYQEDGLSNSFLQLMKNNPRGFCISNMQIIDLYDSWKDRVTAAIHYWAFKFYARDQSIKYCGKHKALVAIMAVPGVLYNLYYRFYRLR